LQDIIKQRQRDLLSPSSTDGEFEMHSISVLRIRGVAAAIACGAILFLAGFAHGYCALDWDAGWHSMPVEH
jgi:hypothetical protein